jgi:indole-3-glycerol phosphate synthase
MNILDKIVAVKKREVAGLIPHAEELRGRAEARRDFRDFVGAVSNRDPVALIAEVKKASPSAGLIRANFDPVQIARQYEAAGAHAISVLTDREFFQGRIEFLEEVRAAVKLPMLRKDFLIDELQVYEAAARGADAILLIVAILDDRQLRDFQALARHLRLAALVEVHDEGEFDRAMAAGARMIGINNRNLRDFSVNLKTTEQLAARLRGTDKIVVAESGIHTRVDVERVAQAGVDAILVGESLMRSGDIAKKVRELLG